MFDAKLRPGAGRRRDADPATAVGRGEGSARKARLPRSTRSP